jgi:hypothetical protein
MGLSLRGMVCLQLQECQEVESLGYRSVTLLPHLLAGHVRIPQRRRQFTITSPW